MPISELKKHAFPDEVARGCSVRFIYQGRLLKENERLLELEFTSSPVIHAQVNDPQEGFKDEGRASTDVEN